MINELKPIWGGGYKMLSYNPFDQGVIEFIGKSHDKGGIGINYQGTPIEVEGKETAIKDKKGDVHIMGNMNVPGTNKKFKDVIKDLAYYEKKSFDTYAKSAEIIPTLHPESSRSDKLAFNSHYLNMLGSLKRLENYSEIKNIIADYQQAVLDTAKERNLDPINFSKGTLKKSKNHDTSKSHFNDGGTIAFSNPHRISHFEMANDNSYDIIDMYYTGGKIKKKKSKKNTKDNGRGESMTKMPEGGELPFIPYRPFTSIPTPPTVDLSYPLLRRGYLPAINYRPATVPPVTPTVNLDNLPELGVRKVDLPRNTSTDNNKRQENTGLRFAEIAPEIFALAENYPVYPQAKYYTPEQYVPYSTSYQDLLNQNLSTFNYLARLQRNNPGALSALAARKYEADTKVMGEQYRQNQANLAQTYDKNIALQNQAAMENLRIADTQYARQQQAISATKNLDIEALSSIASKFLQNRLESKTLDVYSNVMGYQFNPDTNQFEYIGPNRNFYTGLPETTSPGYASQTIHEKVSPTKSVSYHVPSFYEIYSKQMKQEKLPTKIPGIKKSGGNIASLYNKLFGRY